MSVPAWVEDPSLQSLDARMRVLRDEIATLRTALGLPGCSETTEDALAALLGSLVELMETYRRRMAQLKPGWSTQQEPRFSRAVGRVSEALRLLAIPEADCEDITPPLARLGVQGGPVVATLEQLEPSPMEICRVRTMGEVGSSRGASSPAVASTSGIDLLVAEGVAPREALLKFKRLVHSRALRRRFRLAAMDFKGHKSSLEMRQRNLALREIYTSEKKYVDALLVCVNHFMHPLMHNANGSTKQRLLSRGQVAELFHSLDIIVDLNKGLLDDLKARLDQWPSVQKFGDLFVRMAPIFRLYSGYVRNFDAAHKVLMQLKTHAPFSEFLRECERKAGAVGLTLESYLIMPVQRLPRYQLLIDGLLKYTIETHVDYNDLVKARDAVVRILNEINLQKRIDETYVTLRSMIVEVDGLGEALQTTSFLINRGMLKDLKGEQSQYWILFDDFLVKCSTSDTSAQGSLRKTSFVPKKVAGHVIQEVLPFVSVDVFNVEGASNLLEFVLGLAPASNNEREKEVRIRMCAPSSEEGAQWTQKLTAYRAMVASGDSLGIAVKSLLQEACARVKDETSLPSASPWISREPAKGSLGLARFISGPTLGQLFQPGSGSGTSKIDSPSKLRKTTASIVHAEDDDE